ncbi:MAG: RNA polymerase sigma factor [Clostridiales bacterium]|nr:RNA polymerase sigma factor [Clostridiales bacterium]MCI2160600.1 RNA polymerase sigma factor [Oscillospiraceae bacterium]MCI1960989.1 RNA polymerase sigma factor [Clostridiales bacterium]MCI2021430.1 RNA polymerase sigma factor [Clostridiales bacterium]MCI2026216.1 RNA polymerase sigma factor [Clostridiales bacterium]
MEDENLIQRIKTGDVDAMDQLVQKYYGAVYTYCYRKVGNKDDAQDLTQETFLHFCRNFDSYAQRGKVKNYLYTIAHNLYVSMMRKNVPIQLEEWGKEESHNDVDQFEAADSIRKVLSELPDEQRDVILLRFYQDLKIKDIAQITGSGLSVTKYRLSQGIKTIKKLMRGD